MTHSIDMKKMDKYKCDECNEQFDTKCELDKHKKLHWTILLLGWQLADRCCGTGSNYERKMIPCDVSTDVCSDLFIYELWNG